MGKDFLLHGLKAGVARKTIDPHTYALANAQTRQRYP